MSRIGGIDSAALEGLVQRIENLEEQKKEVSESIRDVYAEVKSGGFDVKTVREIVKLRRKDDHTRKEHEEILETYMAALGMA